MDDLHADDTDEMESAKETRAFHIGITILATVVVASVALGRHEDQRKRTPMTPAQYQAGVQGPEVSEP